MESQEASQFNSDFCIQIANHVLLKEAENGPNFVVSPLSFHVMLSLVAVGSQGRTLDQLLTCLGSNTVDELNLLCSHIVDHLTSKPNDDNNLTAGPLVSFVNGVWVDQSFELKPSFEGILRSIYKAEAKAVDFANKANQVIGEVNLWAENATNGLIKELLRPESLDSDTALILANALYFKGAWNRRFDKERTTQKDFHLLNGQTIRIPFMTSKFYEKHEYVSYDGFKVLKLPYQNGQDTREFAMYFFLPDKRDGLICLAHKLNSEPGFWTQRFNLWEEEINDFWIPRFKFSFNFEASTTLKEMGLQLPFMSLGEFTNLIDSPKDLYISKVFHKAYIEVNEDGTEAAASTASMIQLRCRTKRPSFVADHPFMFMIREEKSRTVFFMGAVLNPLVDT